LSNDALKLQIVFPQNQVFFISGQKAGKQHFYWHKCCPNTFFTQIGHLRQFSGVNTVIFTATGAENKELKAQAGNEKVVRFINKTEVF